MGNAVLHCFNWKFKEIAGSAAEIREAGYAAVLVSPPAFSEGKEWFYRYQPIDYRIILSPLGGLDEFSGMIRVLKENGLKTYVDIVFNHMAYRKNDDLDFPGDRYLARYREDGRFAGNRLYGDLSQGLFSAGDFNPKACIDTHDYGNPDKMDDVQNDRICDIRAQEGLPDLDYRSAQVIRAQREYLAALKEHGVAGFRIDAAKHMPVEHIMEVFTADITRGLYVFGEIIPEPHGRYLDGFFSEVDFSAYDFILFETIRKALAPGGSLADLAAPRQLDPFKSLTFAVTHDIPNNDGMRTLILDADDPDRTDEKIAYAYLLGRDGGVPLVYSDKGEADGVYTNLWVGMYKNGDVVRCLRFHNLMYGKKMEILSAGPCHLVFHREGAGLVALNKCADPVTIELGAGKIRGGFLNMRDNGRLDIGGGKTAFTVPPRSYQLYVKADGQP